MLAISKHFEELGICYMYLIAFAMVVISPLTWYHGYLCLMEK